MIRIIIQGDQLNENFAWTTGGYIKLKVSLSQNGISLQNGKLKTRTYTVRQDKAQNTDIV